MMNSSIAPDCRLCREQILNRGRCSGFVGTGPGGTCDAFSPSLETEWTLSGLPAGGAALPPAALPSVRVEQAGPPEHRSGRFCPETARRMEKTEVDPRPGDDGAPAMGGLSPARSHFSPGRHWPHWQKLWRRCGVPLHTTIGGAA